MKRESDNDRFKFERSSTSSIVSWINWHLISPLKCDLQVIWRCEHKSDECAIALEVRVNLCVKFFLHWERLNPKTAWGERKVSSLRRDGKGRTESMEMEIISFYLRKAKTK